MRAIKCEVLMAVAAGMLLATSAPAMTPPDTSDELKCATGMSKGLAKFVGSKQKCITKCQQLARKALIPASDCVPPYAGTTLSCVTLAESKAIAKIGKGCVADCPECYSGGDCVAEANNRVSSTESLLDAFVPLIYCDDSGSGDGLTSIEAKCQDTVAKTLAKFVKAKDKCYDKCIANAFKGVIPPGSCVPPPTDPATAVCINTAEQKAAAAIDKLCLDDPECYVPNFDTGAEWVGIAEAAVDSTITQTYCGFPSAAFLD